MIGEVKKHKAQGCFRAGVPRPWRYTGGRKAAQDRYRASHKEEIKARKRAAYQSNPVANAERSMKWRRDNPEKWKALTRVSNRLQRERLRAEMFDAYGRACACCGESQPLFLDLDHIANDGNVERKNGDGSGVKLLGRLKKRGWPKGKYQILCSNCNQGKHRNGGACPHLEMPNVK